MPARDLDGGLRWLSGVVFALVADGLGRMVFARVVGSFGWRGSDWLFGGASWCAGACQVGDECQ